MSVLTVPHPRYFEIKLVQGRILGYVCDHVFNNHFKNVFQNFKHHISKRDVQQLFYFYDKPYMPQYQLILTYRQNSW